MPYPLLLAGLALSAAGTGASIAANEQSKGAMEGKTSAERVRQKGYQAQADNTFNASLSKSGVDTAKQQLANGEAKRLQAYNEVAKPLPVATNNRVVADQSTPMQRSEAVSQTTANAWSKALGGASAKMGSYQDWQLDQGIKNARAKESLALTGSKSRGSIAALQPELEQASHEGDNLSSIGQLLSAAGLLTGIYGGAAAGAASAAANSPGIGGSVVNDISAVRGADLGTGWNSSIFGIPVPG